MQLDMIGSGRMGASMVQRLLRQGHACVVHDVQASAVAALVKDGAAGATSPKQMVSQRSQPRTIWLMVPAPVVDQALGDLVPLLNVGDVVVDGGNSHYRDDMRRGTELQARGIHYANLGQRDQQPEQDVETTPLRDPALYQFDMNLPEIAEVWRRASVIGSWLLDPTASALLEDPELAQYGRRVSVSGEGRWAIQAAIDEGVPAPVLSAALYSRFTSRGNAEFSNRILSAMRHEFGGHIEQPPS